MLPVGAQADVEANRLAAVQASYPEDLAPVVSHLIAPERECQASGVRGIVGQQLWQSAGRCRLGPVGRLVTVRHVELPRPYS